jgi:lysophospholipase L1-like esterase
MRGITFAICFVSVMAAVSLTSGDFAKEILTPENFHLPSSPKVPAYPFLNMEANSIQYAGDSIQFESFYKKLDRLIFQGEGKVNVLHMGGSHVQAGTLSNRMRENFHSLSDGLVADRGFFFPYRMAHTNTPGNIKIRYTGDWEGCRNAHRKHHCDWGVSGINASTTDTLSSLKIWSFNTDSVNYGFNRVKIFHQLSEDSYAIRPDSSYSISSITVDSTASYTEIQFEQYYDTLKLEFFKLDTLQNHFTLQGISMETDYDGIVYNSIGVNGASVPSFLRCEGFEAQLTAINPDLVIFGIGINDAYKPSSSFDQAKFEAHYDTLITRIKAVNPDAALLFLTNNDSYYKRRYANKNALKVREGMINLADRHQGACWDLFEIMGGLNSIKMWQNAGLAKADKIHLTPQGYVLQADLLFDAIKQAYGDYLEETYN